MFSLHELSSEFYRYAMRYEEAETDAEREEIFTTLQDIKWHKDQKLSNCVGFQKNMLLEIEAIENEIERLKARREAVVNKRNRFLDYIKMCLLPGEKWTNGIHKISWRASTRIEIDSLEKIPPQFLREKITYEPSKSDIKTAIECGGTVPGARLVESMNIQIK